MLENGIIGAGWGGPTPGVTGAVRKISPVFPHWARLAGRRPLVDLFWASGSLLSVIEGEGRYVV